MDTSEEGIELNLPCKDYDIPIFHFFHDALFDSSCQTVFDLFISTASGDLFFANGAIQLS